MKLSVVLMMLVAACGLANLVPTGGALDVGCVSLGQILAPIDAPTNGWTPQCVSVKSGDTVTFTNADDQEHQPALKTVGSLKSCFLGTGFASGSQYSFGVKTTATGVHVVWSDGTTRDCAFATVTNGMGIVDGGDHVTLFYHCNLHPVMTGQIVVAK